MIYLDGYNKPYNLDSYAIDLRNYYDVEFNIKELNKIKILIFPRDSDKLNSKIMPTIMDNIPFCENLEIILQENNPNQINEPHKSNLIKIAERSKNLYHISNFAYSENIVAKGLVSMIYENQSLDNLAKTIKENPIAFRKLKCLQLISCKFNENLQEIFQVFSKYLPNIVYLQLQNINLRDCISEFLDFIKNIPIETLVLRDIKIGELNFKSLFDLLVKKESLHFLDVSQNELSDKVNLAISLFLQSNQHKLHYLNLDLNKFTGNAAIAFSRTISNNKNLCKIEWKGFSEYFMLGMKVLNPIFEKNLRLVNYEKRYLSLIVEIDFFEENQRLLFLSRLICFYSTPITIHHIRDKFYKIYFKNPFDPSFLYNSFYHPNIRFHRGDWFHIYILLVSAFNSQNRFRNIGKFVLKKILSMF